MKKVALEVCIGAAYGGARPATMKHVGLNVASDPFFTVAYTGVTGALVVVSADDPGMASSQNEQDNRRFAVAAGVPMLEPADSQERTTSSFRPPRFPSAGTSPSSSGSPPRLPQQEHRAGGSPGRRTEPAAFVRDVRGRVMIPAYARMAHRRLRQKLAEMALWNETGP